MQARRPLQVRSPEGRYQDTSSQSESDSQPGQPQLLPEASFPWTGSGPFAESGGHSLVPARLSISPFRGAPRQPWLSESGGRPLAALSTAGQSVSCPIQRSRPLTAPQRPRQSSPESEPSSGLTFPCATLLISNATPRFARRRAAPEQAPTIRQADLRPAREVPDGQGIPTDSTSTGFLRHDFRRDSHLRHLFSQHATPFGLTVGKGQVLRLDRHPGAHPGSMVGRKRPILARSSGVRSTLEGRTSAKRTTSYWAFPHPASGFQLVTFRPYQTDDTTVFSTFEGPGISGMGLGQRIRSPHSG